MNLQHNIESIQFEKDKLIIKVDGQLISIKVKDISPKLAAASEKEKKLFEITPSGYGIHWPLIDEDLSINGIMKKYKSA